MHDSDLHHRVPSLAGDSVDRLSEVDSDAELAKRRLRGDASSLLAARCRRARWTLLWERLWPPLATLATAIGLFLAVSWLGLWLWLPPLGRAIGLFVFAVLTAAATGRCCSCAFQPLTTACAGSTAPADCRIVRRPSIADDIATSRDDPWSLALWRAHVERALLRRATPDRRQADAAARAARPDGAARAGADSRDRRRSSPPATIAAGASPPRSTGRASSVPANFRLDAWVSPPTYTGKPPVILPGMRPGRNRAGAGSAGRRCRPAACWSCARAARFASTSSPAAALPRPRPRRPPQVPSQTEEQRFTITDRGTATVRGVGNDIVWSFIAIPDRVADHRTDQGSRAAGARRRCSSPTRSKTTTASSKRRRCSRSSRTGRRQRRSAASALRRARRAARAAAAAHPQRRRPDHEGPVRASVVRRRCDDRRWSRATRPATKAAAPPPNSACRSARSPSRWRGR